MALEWEVLGEEPLGDAPAATPVDFPSVIRAAEASPTGVSPKGAATPMQVMPRTALDPGFGVEPAANDSPAEVERVGVDYAKAMLDLFKSPALAGAAYNAGPGTVVDWMRGTNVSGKNPSLVKLGDPRRGEVNEADFLAKIPFPETNAYVQRVAALAGQQPGAGQWEVLGEQPLTGNETPIAAPSGNWEVLGEAPLAPAAAAPTNLQEDAAQRRARDLATLQDPNKALMPALDSVSPHIAEFFKQLIPGAAGLLTGAGQGAAALTQEGAYIPPEYQTAMQNWAVLSPYERNKIRQKAQTDMPSDRNFVLQGMFQQLDKGKTPAEVLASPQARLRGAPPRTVKTEETPLYKEATALQKRIQEAPWFKPAPGYEQSPGGALGQAVGSMGAGIATTMLTGGAGAPAVLFTLSQAGQQVQDAIEKGASENQIMDAAAIGGIPGLADSVPIEILLGHIPVPGVGRIKVPAGMIGNALKVVGRIGMQAFAEGFQEGGQQWLQNEVARAIYNPAQQPFEGVVPNAGAGTGAGAIAETGKEIIELIGGRRVRRAMRAAAPPPPAAAPAAPAAAPPHAQPAPGAPPAAPPAQAAQARPTAAPPPPAAAAPPAVEEKPKGKDWVPLYDEAGNNQIGWQNSETGAQRVLDEETGEFKTVEPGFKTTPGALTQEHDDEVRRLETEALQAAAAKKGVSPPSEAPSIPPEALSKEPGAPSSTPNAAEGTRAAPVKEPETPEDIEPARNAVETEPSEAQKEAGNSSKGHVQLHGLGITIETPKGIERRGPLDEEGEPAWVNVHPEADYGYIKRTIGADATPGQAKGQKEKLDVYIGPNPQSEKAFVIDQYDPDTDEFDEHKAILGANSQEEALAIYDAGFSDGSGPSRRPNGGLEMSIENFKRWLKEGDTKKAIIPQAVPSPERRFVTPEQAQEALKTDIDPETGEKPKGLVALRAFRERMKTVISGQGNTKLAQIPKAEHGEAVAKFYAAYPGKDLYSAEAFHYFSGWANHEQGFPRGSVYHRTEMAQQGFDEREAAHPHEGEWTPFWEGTGFSHPAAEAPDKRAFLKALYEKGEAAFGGTSYRIGMGGQGRTEPVTEEELKKGRGAPLNIIEASGKRTTTKPFNTLEEAAAAAIERAFPQETKAKEEKPVVTHETKAEAHPDRVKADVERLLKIYDEKGADAANARFKEVEPGQHSREVAEAFRDALRERKFEKVAEGGERPKDDRGKPIFKKGERVVIGGEGEFAGRHGVIFERHGMTMRPIFGGGKEETTFSYIVKTDQGAETYASEFEPETGQAPEVIPDIEVTKGNFDTPQTVQRRIVNAKESAKKARAAADRARKPENKRALIREAERSERDAVSVQRDLDAWKAKHPEEAERIFGKTKPPTTAEEAKPSAVSAPVAGAVVSQNEAKNGVEIKFKDRPDEATLDKLKAAGFRWSKFQKLWYATRSAKTLALAQSLQGKPAAAEPTAPPPGTALAPKLFLEIGNRRFPVDSLEDASEKMRATIETMGIGGSQTPQAFIKDGSGNLIGHVAYNGRIFPGRPEDWKPGIKPIYEVPGWTPPGQHDFAEQPKPKNMLENNRNTFEANLRKEGKARYGASLYETEKTGTHWLARRDRALIGSFPLTPEGEQQAIRLAIDTAFPSLTEKKPAQDIDPEALRALRREYPNIKDPEIENGQRVGPKDALSFLWGWDRAKGGAARGGFGTPGEATGFDAYKRAHPEEKPVVPHDNWRNNLIKAREYARSLGVADKVKDWTKLADIVSTIDTHLGIPSAPAAKLEKGWTEIGKNNIGQTLYEDHRGVRSIIEGGVRTTEPVALRPSREGTKFSVDRKANPEYELAEVHPALAGRAKEMLRLLLDDPNLSEQDIRLRLNRLLDGDDIDKRVMGHAAIQMLADEAKAKSPEAKASTSWKPEVYVDGQWAGNALRFATKKEAEDNAKDLYGRWTSVKEWRVSPSDEPITHTWVNGALQDVKPKPAWGDTNTEFPKSEAEAARERLLKRARGQTMTVGFDPELMRDGLALAGFHVEAGARSFIAYAGKMLEDLGEWARPYLKLWYNAVRDYPGMNTAGMTPSDEITPELIASIGKGEVTKAYYVTMIREPGPRQKVAWLAGPFASHADALGMVDKARAAAEKADAFTAFDAFGTASRESAGKHPPGTINKELGLPNDPRTEPLPVPKEPSDLLADKVTETLAHDHEPITAKDLQNMAEEAYGGTLASGTVPRDEMYDAAELGLNRLLLMRPALFSPAVNEQDATIRAGDIEALKNRMPTQTVRAGEKETHQQFSTPPDYSYAAAWVANLNPGDVVLEPSAGTGSFVTHAVNAGVKVHANDLSDRRAAMLRTIVPNVTTENAEHIHAILPKEVRPTVVLMNPPFSATAGRMGDRMVIETGAKHLEEALRRLEPGGRLVAIVGKGMNPTAATFRDFWKRIGAANDIRANIGVEGDIYKKYGTTFPTRLIVIDKVAPSGRAPIVVEGIKDATGIIEALSEVRNDRTLSPAAEREQPQPSRPEVAEGGEGAGEPSAPLHHPAGPLGPGEGGRAPVRGGPGVAARPSEPAAGGKGKRGQGAGSGVSVAPLQPGRPGTGGAGVDLGTATPGREDALGSGSGGAGDGIRPDGSGERVDPGITEAPLTVRAAEESVDSENVSDAPLTDAVYEPYKPQRTNIEGAKEHPGALVQSAAMASVMPPATTHTLTIPKKVIEKGELSDAQLEAVIYAGAAHGEMIPQTAQLPERRRGFFIGDGTGVGKGREVAGIMLDNWGQGRKKHIWISEKRALVNDARRDWKGVGQDPKDIFDHGSAKAGDKLTPKRGILFTTYDTLKSAEQIGKGAEKQRGQTRIQQIIDWVGEDFDGVIAFDESHNLGNSFDMRGNRGMKKAAAKALAGIELQNRLPKARVIYVSATGATEVNNLAYADRLGLWGRGTAFADRNDFLAKVSRGGIAAMELVARDMKALGLYIARNLSYDGVEYDRVEHTLSANQRQTYDKLAEAWQLVLRNFHQAMEASGITATDDSGRTRTQNAQAKSAILSQFWGGHQRFFNQIITSMQMPTVLKAVEKDLKEGRQAVLQLVNTNEAAQERALAKISAEEGPEALEDLDMTPRDQLLQLVQNAFPTARFEEYVDESGNTRSRPVLDAKGNPVHDPALEEARDRLLDELGSIRVPDGPLEMLLNHFGVEKVAEVTGRKQRVVRKPDEKTGEMRTVVEKRPGQSNVAEASLFQEAKKPILVFSEAGGTGRSYHADINSASKNARRSHYLVQAGWRADKAVQGFGRTHRTNQASAPIFHLVTTDLQGQKRFISSIARRLGQLGALTKGERRTGDQGMFGLRDNLESPEANAALQAFFNDALSNRIEGIGPDVFEDQMGLKVIDPSTGRILLNEVPMTQFLNRLLSLGVDMQNRVFTEFGQRFDDVIDRATAAGTLDAGLETYRADKITKKSEQTVYTDARTGAETRHVHLIASQRNFPKTYDAVVQQMRSKNEGGRAHFTRSLRSGKLFAVVDAANRTNKDGDIIDQKRLVGPLDYQFIDSHRLEDPKFWQDLGALTIGKQNEMWDAEVAKIPEFSDYDLHLITGAVLPIWDRLAGNPRIYRLQTDKGQRLLGRVIPNDSVNETLERLGAEKAKLDLTPEVIVQRILETGQRAKLTNGWTIKRSLVSGERRLELVGPDYAFFDQLRRDGAFVERISWQTRIFLPTGPEAADVLDRITKGRPVIELSGAVRERDDDTPLGEAEQAQTAYHGSPYDFDKFKNEAIGTGEGAATYGYGHYFAGKREVAEYYREALSAHNATVKQEISDLKRVIAQQQQAASSIQRDIDDNENNPHLLPRYFERRREDIAEIKTRVSDMKRKLAELEATPKGKLYHVNLAPKDDEWLDYDKPLREQSDKVKGVLRSLGYDVDSATITDARLYENGRRYFQSKQAEADARSDIGIRQIMKAAHDAFQKGPEAYAAHVRAMDGGYVKGRLLGRHYTEADRLGGELYEQIAFALSREPGGTYGDRKQLASNKLLAAGIPGIRYADQGSRNVKERMADAKREIPHVKKNIETIKKNIEAVESGALGETNKAHGAAQDREHLKFHEDRLAELERDARGEQTYNYVVFDPEHIKIEAKFQVPKPFYSALTRAIEESTQKKASAGQWQATIRNAKGIKQDEIDWSGVKDWIAGHGDKPIAKEDLVNFLKASEPDIKEVMLKSREAPGEEGIAGGAMQHARYRELETRDLATEPFTPMERSLYDWLNNHPEATDIEYLTREYDLWTSEQGLPNMSADELELDLREKLREVQPNRRAQSTLNAQIAWLHNFGERWTEAQGEEHFAGRDETKFGSYTLPGGENYRELLLTLPPNEQAAKAEYEAAKKRMLAARTDSPEWETLAREAQEAEKRYRFPETFRSGHFNEPNILAHIRFNDRFTSADGTSYTPPQRTLFIEEIQSDWHQRGRKQGYAGERKAADYTAKLESVQRPNTFPTSQMIVRDAAGLAVGTYSADTTPEQAVKTYLAATDAHRVPDAPFKTTWQELAFKRMVRYAAENGYDQIAWTTGEQQADRYDLSKHINRLVVEAMPDGRYHIEAYAKDRGAVGFPTAIEAKNLPDYVGKDMADKIVNDLKGRDGKPTGGKTYAGLDLKVGGEGMRGFYDKILPAFANKYGKKWGAQVGTTDIGTGIGKGDRWEVFDGDGEGVETFPTRAQAERRAEDGDLGVRELPVGAIKVHSLPITPAMIDSVMQGQPLFKRPKDWTEVETAPGEAREEPLQRIKGATLYGEPLGALSAKEKELVANVERIIKGLAPAAEVTPMRNLRIGEKNKLFGAVYQNMGQRMIAWALDAPDPIATGRHEVVHWLRAQGYITDPEWAALEKAARAGNWIKKHNIKARYPTLSESEQLEEAIADEFGEWRPERPRVEPQIKTVFQRIAAALQRIKAVAQRIFGPKVTYQDVFGRIESGEVGKREPVKGRGMGRTKFQVADPTGSAAFKRWFGKSKVVDEDGKPLVVYHGTDAQGIETFDARLNQIKWGDKELEFKAFNFTDSQDVAASYGDNVMAVYLSLQNPKVLNARGQTWDNFFPFGKIAQVVADGVHDGLIIKNIRDEASGAGERSTVYIAFKPSQIKSTQNQGTFNPEDDRIMASVPQVPSPPPPTFDDPASEQRWQDARKGAGAGQNIITQAKDWLDYVKAGITQHWINLPNVPKYANLQQQLHKLEAAPEAANEEIIRALRKIVGKLTPEDLDLFTRKVVLDDLSYEVDQEHDLPFGLTDIDVPRELAKVDAAIAARPDIAARVRERKAFTDRIKQALVDNGVLDAKRVKNPAYYRHQVLEYARTMASGATSGAKKLRTPKWAKRMGSSKDINANYLEAEFDWLRKALNDIAAAKTIEWIKESPHNIRERVVSAAKASNQRLVDSALAADQQARGYMKGGKLTSPMTEQWTKFRQRIAMGLENVRQALEGGALVPPPWYEDAADAIQNGTRDDSVLPFLSWILDNDEPGSMGAATAFKAIAGRKRWVQDLLGRNYADPTDIKDLIKRGLAPDGYTTWQPDEGKLLFTAKTIPEHALQSFLSALAEKTPEQAAAELGLPLNVSKGTLGARLAEELVGASRDILAVGGDRYTMVIPQEVADTLNSLRNVPEQGIFDAVVRAPLRLWKQWVLINPMRVLKYNLNNLSGDLDAIIAGAPRVVKLLPKATKELGDVMVRGKEPTAEYKDAVERGVFNAGITIQEVPDVNSLSEFEHLMAKDRTVLGKALRPFGATWRFLRKYTTFRENMLRYAAYLDYLNRLNAGEPMSKIGYGASNPEMVDAVTDNKDKAALLARDLVGDYGAVSHFGQSLRRTVIPFWSWTEINTKRYWRLSNNSWNQGVGKGFATAGILGASLGLRTTAYLALRMFAMFALIALWNRLMWGDDEDKLDPEQARQLHILLGHDSNGEIRSLRVQGAVSDALSWIGFLDAMGAMSEVGKGRGSVWDILAAVAKAPVKKLAGGITPVISVPVEFASGQSYFPDVFNPIPVRDKWREAFRLFSLDPAYDAVMGKPTRGIGHTAAAALIYQRDPGELAYDQIRGMTFDWLAKNKGESGVGSATTARGEALREWRTAARYGDKRAARVAFEKMKALGINRQSANRSLAAAAPLGSLSLADRRAFFATLTPQEQDRVKDAEKWYKDTLVQGAAEATRMLPEGEEQ